MHAIKQATTHDGLVLTTSTASRYAVFVIEDENARAARFADELGVAHIKHRQVIQRGAVRVVLADLERSEVLKDTLNRRPLDNRPARLRSTDGRAAAYLPPMRPRRDLPRARTETFEPDCVRCTYAGPDKADHRNHGGAR